MVAVERLRTSKCFNFLRYIYNGHICVCSMEFICFGHVPMFYELVYYINRQERVSVENWFGASVLMSSTEVMFGQSSDEFWRLFFRSEFCRISVGRCVRYLISKFLYVCWKYFTLVENRYATFEWKKLLGQIFHIRYFVRRSCLGLYGVLLLLYH